MSHLDPHNSQILEMPKPPMSTASGSYSADGYFKETPQTYLTEEMPTPYNMNNQTEKEHHRHPHRPNPHRKYSKQWFSTGWEIAVEVGRWPRVGYLAFGGILVAIWIIVMLAFANEEVRYEKASLAGVLPKHGLQQILPGQLMTKGILRNFDPVARILTVQWTLVTFDTDNTTLITLGATNDTAWPFNLYRDVKAVPEDRTSPRNISIDLSDEYRVDNVTEVPIAVLGLHDWDGVDTDIDFTQAQPDNAWKQPLFAYPFDQWAGSIVLAATDRKNSEFLELNNSLIVELSGATLGDSTLNWRIDIEFNDTCQTPEIFAGCELHINFTGRRPGLVIFAALVAVIVNWTSTIGIFLITGEAVVMQRYYILKETDILGVCLTALFALPSVRAILPGAPDFGAIIDLIGIIPNILIISLCTTAFALNKLATRRPSKEEKDD